MTVGLRTMDGFMTARAPAGPFACKSGGVIHVADEDPGGRLLLEMAAQAQRGVTRNEHSRVHAAVRVVAGGAAFAHRLMLEHERPELLGVALGADFILPHEFRPAALDDRAFVRIVAVAATDLAFEDGMVRGQMEFSLLVQMALETRLGRFARINDGFGSAAGRDVEAAGPVAGFTSDVLGVVAGGLQMIMGRALEVARDVLMALRARLRADISGSGNLRRQHLDPADVGARNQAQAGQRAQEHEQHPRQAAFPAGDGLKEFLAQNRFHNKQKTWGVFLSGIFRRRDENRVPRNRRPSTFGCGKSAFHSLP